MRDRERFRDYILRHLGQCNDFDIMYQTGKGGHTPQSFVRLEIRVNLLFQFGLLCALIWTNLHIFLQQILRPQTEVARTPVFPVPVN